ncbi:MAG TPA: hypothetical protein VHB20_01290 [Verrucomicrobiae bacterium]|jgi:hypothetical protein|nr:hypothetical protein [Verrucomicrobiae bacterium]
MLTRIFLIVAIVAGLAAAGISAYFGRNVMLKTIGERDDYHTQLTAETKAKTEALAKLKKTEGDLKDTTAKLTQTQGELATANGRVTDLETQNKDLTTTLTRTRADRDTAQQELDKWRQIGLQPEQVKAVIANLASTQKERDQYIAENKIIVAKANELQRELDALRGPAETVLEPAGLRGHILSVDPKFGFVVLDIGSDNGLLERGEMLVDHGGQFVGKVRIVSVAKNRAIANILPNWTKGDINEDCRVID